MDDSTNKSMHDLQAQGLNPVMLPLTPFIGAWRWEATLLGEPYGSGRTIFEWLEGGTFLIVRDKAEEAGFPDGISVIGGDDTTGEYCMIQVDPRPESRIYGMSFSDGVWKQWRDAPGFSQRFTGTFSAEGDTIIGLCEKSEDGQKWDYDFDITYTRIR